RQFFFSSRRRHTRFSRDWSSDVCSSDLEGELEGLDARVAEALVEEASGVTAGGRGQLAQPGGAVAKDGLGLRRGAVRRGRGRGGRRGQERRNGEQGDEQCPVYIPFNSGARVMSRSAPWSGRTVPTSA